MKDNKEIKEPIQEPVGETTESEVVTGVVSNCKKLNIRKRPSKKGEVITEILAGTTLTINVDKSKGAWYSIITPSGEEGFCMKEFVTLQ